MRPKRGKIFYGWYMVIITFLMMSLSYGVYYSWPIFFIPILTEFNWTRAETSVIFSVGSLVYGLGSLVSGILFDRIGPRKLFLGATALLAIGTIGASQSHNVFQLSIFVGALVALGTTCAGFVPSAALISRWFIKRRATALGLSQSGTRDAFLLAPLLQVGVVALGWRQTYIWLGVAVLVIMIPLALLMHSRPEDIGLLPDGRTDATEGNGDQGDAKRTTVHLPPPDAGWTIAKVLREYRFWALFLIMIGSGFVFTSTINHLVALVTDIGFTPIFAASMLTVYAFCAMISRGFSFVSDYWGRETTFTLAMGLTILPLPILLLGKDAISPWMLYLFIASFGFGNGLYNPCYAASASDLFHGKSFGTIIGLANVGFGLSASVGTWLYAYIFDLTKTYNPAIVITMLAASMMTGGIWLAAPRKAWRKQASANGA